MSDTVVKIYELRTIGAEKVTDDLDSIGKKLDEVKKAKQAYDAVMSKSSGTKTETDEIRKQTEEIAKLRTEEQKLKVDRQQLLNEAKALTIARQKENEELRKQKKASEDVAGSYNALYKQFKTLNAELRATPETAANFEQLKATVKSLATQIQDFNRQFSRDGLLVGEYTSGIVQAFKKMGLDDLIGGQIQKAGDRLKTLDSDFERLQQTLQELKSSGGAGFDAIEKEMIANRKEALALQQQVGTLQQEFKGIGDVGSQVTTGLKNAFAQLKGQIAQFAIGFYGVQAVFQKSIEFISGSREEFEHAETSVARFQATLANMGRQNEFDALNAQVEALASAFKFLDNDDIRDAAEKLVVYGKVTKEQIGQLLPIIIDFATRQRISIQEATDVIIKGLEGNGKALKTYGINLKDAGSEAEAYGIIVNDLGKKIAGSASTFDATNTGALARTKQGFRDIQEEIGSKLIPILTGLGSIVLTVVSAFTAIPFPLLVTGLVSLTASLALYKAEQIRAYIATSIASKEGLIYLAYTRAQAIATAVTSAATRLATAEIVLFNGALRISPLGAILTLLGLLGGAFAAFASKVQTTVKEFKAMAEVDKAASEVYNAQIGRINALISIYKSAATSADTKRKVMQELININPAFLKAVDGEAFSIKKLDEAYRSVTEAIRKKAIVEASAKLSAEKEAAIVEVTTIRQRIESGFAIQGAGANLTDVKLGNILPNEANLRNIKGNITIGGINYDFETLKTALKKVEDDRILAFQQYKNIQEKAEADMQKLMSETSSGNKSAAEVDMKNLQDRKKSLDDQISNFRGSLADLKKLIAERNALQKEIDGLTGTKAGSGGKSSKDPMSTALALLDEKTKAEKSILEVSRKQNEIDETTYQQSLLKIQDEYLDQKLLLYLKYKPKETAAIKEIKAERIIAEIEANDAIFQSREKLLADSLEIAKKQAEASLNAINGQPGSTEEEKVKAKTDFDNAMLQAQIVYNSAMDQLEKEFNKTSIENAMQRKEEVTAISRNLSADEISLLQAQLNVIRSQGSEAVAAYQKTFSDVKLGVVKSNLPQPKKDESLKALDEAEQRGSLAIEVKTLQDQMPLYKKLLAAKAITQEEYYNFEKGLNDKSITLGELTTKSLKGTEKEIRTVSGLLKDTLSNLFKFGSGNADLDKLLADTIAQSFNLAKNAMDGYYDAERQRIEQSKQANLERLELEKQQLLARAQSRDEELAIEKQFQAKKEAEDRKAFEKNKKIQRAQAAINLATQLSNLAVIAFAPNPANIATLGVAGAVMYAVQAALAIAGYFSNLKRINSATYEFGGSPDMPERGGKIGGKRHKDGGTPFVYKGRQYEAEVDELAIIRTKNAPKGKQYSISGTWTQIASKLNQLGGGVSFAPGAKASQFEYGGSLGESLQAPVFVPSTSGGGFSASVLEEIKQAIDLQSDSLARNAEATNRRIDRLQVYQVTSTVTNAQAKEARQAQIGNL